MSLPWVFAALACGSSDRDTPENEPPVGSGDDTATVVDGPDADGDGYGASVDCDDSEPDMHPDAKETCGNGRDDNCNGTADGCDWSGANVLEGTELSIADGGAVLGFSLAVCDANGDGVDDVVTGANGSGDMTGAVYIFYGPIGDDQQGRDADYVLMGRGDQPRVGFSVDCRRDLDGDGLPDIVVGAPGQGIGYNRLRGTVYVVPGGGTGHLPIADGASSTWKGTYPRDGLGHQVVAIDVDGDDTDELAVTPNLTDSGPRQFGIAYLFEYAGPGEHDADASAAAYVYGDEGDRLMTTVGNAGDLDGDGVDELAITGTDEASDEWLVFGAPLVGPIPKSDADARIVGGPVGTAEWSGIGHADLDADGLDDLIVGNRSENYGEGAVYAFLSPIAHHTNEAAAELRFLGAPGVYDVGSDVTSPGDVDGDGIADLLIGAAYGATVYLQYGGDPGAYVLETDAQASWRPEDWWTQAGTAVAAGDVTGDGVVDLLIGSPTGGDNNQGSVTIVPAFQI